MKMVMLSLIFFCGMQTLFSQPGGIKPFLGQWEGTLHWYQTGKKAPQKVKMRLHIKPTDTAGVYAWQLAYGERGEDNRPYLLKAVDTAQGHWQIDERNGIVLDQYIIGDRLTAAFTVQTATIVNSYWRDGNTLVAEFYSLSAKPVATTGFGTDESPAVQSYAAKGYQRAVLKRKRL